VQFRPRLAILAVLPALAVAACGSERAEPADPRPAAGEPTHRVDFPKAGLTLTVPKRAVLVERRYPGVARISMGQPLVATFAYAREEQIPRRKADLKAARRRLKKEVERRDPDFELRSASLTEVDGAKAIELVGDQTISRAKLRTRSLHVFKRKAEYVFELLVPVREFSRSDRLLFEPMLSSAQLTGKVKDPKAERKKRREERKKRREDAGAP
jgi:hypothetical protein